MPLFANAAAGDFRELAGPPTVNAGTVAAGMGSLDLDRQPRTQGSAPDIGAYELDEIAPDTTITAGPSGSITDTAATFTFAATEAGSSFQCPLDGAAFGACSGPGDSHTAGGLAAGGHIFAVRAIDPVGNVDPSPAEQSFTVSSGRTRRRRRPRSPRARRQDHKDRAKFKFTSSEPGTFECKRDKKPFKPCRSPKAIRNLDRGKHKFQVRAIDAVGNVDLTPDKDRWKVLGSGK